jgi:hexaprenyl-diphosphate synthase
LDFTVDTETLGKEAAVDLKLGLATAPVLFAAQQYPEMLELMQRKFSEAGDVEKARQLVKKSSGIEQGMKLAQHYSILAKNMIAPLPNSRAKDGLDELATLVIQRKH